MRRNIKTGTTKPVVRILPMIMLLAFLSLGLQAQSSHVVVLKDEKGKPFIAYQNSWALLIGINKYSDSSWANLRYCAADAKDLAKLLLDFQFPKENIIVLTNEEATKGRILSELSALGDRVRRNDRLLVFWSGRSTQYEGRGFLVPYDASMRRTRQTCLSSEEILGNKSPKHELLILDTGSLLGERDVVNQSYKSRGILPISFDEIRSVCSFDALQVITAGYPERPKESPSWQHGAITYTLLKGLQSRSADLDTNGVVSATELFSYIRLNVKRLTPNVNPTLTNLKYSLGEFLFSYPERSSHLDSISMNIEPPTITILEPERQRGVELEKEEKELFVIGKVTTKHGIYELTANGKPANVFADGNFWAKVILGEGTNSIKIKVVDSYNNFAIDTFRVSYVKREMNAVDESEIAFDLSRSKYYALLIANQHYQDPGLLLYNPIRDIDSLRSVLVSRYAFQKQNIDTLIDPDRKSILKTLRILRQKLEPNDNLLIFYAGHGSWDEDVKQGYWLPCDAVWDDPSSFLSNSDIKDQIRGMKSGHILLITDACFSGSIFKAREGPQPPKSVAETYRLASRQALTSGALKTVPDRSVFVEYILKALKENHQKFLYSKQLYLDIKDAVTNNSPVNQTPLHGVILEAGDEGGDFIFVAK